MIGGFGYGGHKSWCESQQDDQINLSLVRFFGIWPSGLRQMEGTY